MTLRALVFVLGSVGAAACGPRQGPAGGGGGGDELPELGPAEPERTELERRQHAACERVIPRLTACAVEDARQHLTPEEFEREKIDEAAAMHTKEFLRRCKDATMSSRQVRVYEVCDREETACGPLVACLDHAQPRDDE